MLTGPRSACRCPRCPLPRGRFPTTMSICSRLCLLLCLTARALSASAIVDQAHMSAAPPCRHGSGTSSMRHGAVTQGSLFFYPMDDTSPEFSTGAGQSPCVTVTTGTELPPAVSVAVRRHLGPWLTTMPSSAEALNLHFGVCPLVTLEASAEEIPAGGFLITRRGQDVCALGSSPLQGQKHSLGAAHAAYEVLELLGFAFLHPLEAVRPSMLNGSSIPDGMRHLEVPRFDYRGFHIHTEHPLELTELLQGSDAHLPNGSLVPWEEMLDGADSMFEWLVANRQNRVEWVLLTTPAWEASGWVMSSERQGRLRALNVMCHAYGLQCGADVPIADIQQRGWHMVDSSRPLATMIEQIRQRLRWLLSPEGAAFDFVSTESGFSEFTHGSCSVMLALISAVADIAELEHGAKAYIKCHSSTGQTCADITDPRTGRPINFNFLPMLASGRMGVLPHSVQAYSLDDATDGTYGNDNFTALASFMWWEAAHDATEREVVFHPETDYWVNVDIDVPLFLPLYGERRLHDMRLIAARQGGRRVEGQMVFDSGWEWGSWFSDVIAARAAWDPLVQTAPAASASGAFAIATQRLMRRLLRTSGAPSADVVAHARAIADVLVRLAASQRSLLIYGSAPSDGLDGVLAVRHTPSPSGGVSEDSPLPAPSLDELRLLSGFGYLSGRDAWTDLLSLLHVANTQPARIDFHEHSHPLYPRVLPLLSVMNQTFTTIAADLKLAVRDAITATGGPRMPRRTDAAPKPVPSATSMLAELSDSATMLAMRAEFVLLLYAASAPRATRSAGALAHARELLTRAAELVARRQAGYRVDPQRIAGWRSTPTSYGQGYLWTVKTLYFWWREYGRVERASLEAAVGPCYLNKQFALDVAFGKGQNISAVLRGLVRAVPIVGPELGDCLSPPSREYAFPRDLYRYGRSTSNDMLGV